MLAVVASGHADLADVFLLVAFIFAAFATILAVVKGAAEGALLPAAVTFLALGLLVL
jgi:hypothetical protein